MMLFLVHPVAFYKDRDEVLLPVGEVMQQPLFTWRD